LDFGSEWAFQTVSILSALPLTIRHGVTGEAVDTARNIPDVFALSR
jgi:hypothetical protein